MSRRHPISDVNFLGDSLGVFAFQTYDDDAARKDPQRAKTYIGRIDEYLKTLAEATCDRCAVHVTINDTDGKRHIGANVVKVPSISSR